MKKETFLLENQDKDIDEDTFVEIEETSSGKVSIKFRGEDEPCVFLETYGQEVRVLIYNDYESQEPDIIVLPAISGGW